MSVFTGEQSLPNYAAPSGAPQIQRVTHVDPSEITIRIDGAEYIVTHRTKIMQAHKSGGAKKYWMARVLVNLDKDEAYTASEAWSVNAKGVESKHVLATPSRIVPKNVGRSNETSSSQQAVLEVLADLMKKRDKMYWGADEPEPGFLEMPMTAKTFATLKPNGIQLVDAKHITFPAFVQPKYDGNRMLMDGRTGWTRGLKPYIAGVIEHMLCVLPPGIVLDGEIMLPHKTTDADGNVDGFTFQETMTVIKKARPLSKRLEYHVYDLVDRSRPEAPFSDRHALVQKIVAEIGWPFKLVPTELVHSDQEVFDAHDRFVAEDYEGAMIRNLNGAYKASTTRSGDLQKMKAFFDEEFPVVGFEEGKGKWEGVPIFLCQAKNGETFAVPMDGPMHYLRLLWSDRQKIVAHRSEVTVRFQSVTDSGVPRFPRGQGVRDFG